MIVFDLRCGKDHVFEAWFASSAAYEEQREGGLLSCPLCGDGTIGKALMAPNLPAKGNRSTPREPAAAPEAVKAAMAALARAQQEMLANSQWVGSAFATKARAMHEGEIDHAPIHGQASIAEAKALLDDGVAVAPLPFPVVPPNARN
ncbi:MAG: DUF1178 family protein [Sphingomonas sp.]